MEPSSIFLQCLYALALIAQIILGFICAYRLDGGYPLWLRLTLLSPALSSVFTVYHFVHVVVTGAYVQYAVHVAMADIHIWAETIMYGFYVYTMPKSKMLHQFRLKRRSEDKETWRPSCLY